MKKSHKPSRTKKISNLSAYTAAGAAALAVTDSAQSAVVTGFSGMIVQATDTNANLSVSASSSNLLVIAGFGSIYFAIEADHWNFTTHNGNPENGTGIAGAGMGGGNLNVGYSGFGPTNTFRERPGSSTEIVLNHGPFPLASLRNASSNVSAAGLFYSAGFFELSIRTTGSPMSANNTFHVGLQNAAGNLGWVQLSWVASGDGASVSNTLTVLNWAYEDQINTPIHVIPEPSSAAMLLLAAGAVGLRRQRKLRTEAISTKSKKA